MSMSEQKAGEPHAFVERANLPFAIPEGTIAGLTPMEVPVRRTEAPSECAICGKPASDPLHTKAEQEAQSEELHWPVD